MISNFPLLYVTRVYSSTKCAKVTILKTGMHSAGSNREIVGGIARGLKRNKELLKLTTCTTMSPFPYCNRLQKEKKNKQNKHVLFHSVLFSIISYLIIRNWFKSWTMPDVQDKLWRYVWVGWYYYKPLYF